MGKFSSCNALVFSVKQSADNRSTVSILSETDGMIYATMYGGAKSKLKSLVSPWNCGKIYLSESNQNSFLKITDFEVKKYHLSFRTDLYKNLAASLALEVVLKSNSAGSYEKSFYYLQGFLDGLDLCTEKTECETGLLRFLWRYLSILGILPELEICSDCEKTILKKDESNYSEENVYFLTNEQNFICQNCFINDFSEENKFIKLQKSSFKYLYGILNFSPKEIRNIKLSDSNISEIKRIIFYFIENIFQDKLKTLETGRGIL